MVNLLRNVVQELRAEMKIAHETVKIDGFKGMNYLGSARR